MSYRFYTSESLRGRGNLGGAVPFHRTETPSVTHLRIGRCGWRSRILAADAQFDQPIGELRGFDLRI